MTIATRFWTWGELRTKVEQDLDLEGETFIQPTEMLGYGNEAVEAAEKILLGLSGGADYFLDKAALTLVSGQDTYTLPAKIYAHKIRGITYRNGSRTYQIHRVRDWKKFQEYELNQVGGPVYAAEYKFFLLNSAAGAPTIIFTPSVVESGTYVSVWYQRVANRFYADSDVLDVPEAANYVMQYMKKRCYEKEGHPNLPLAIVGLNKEESDLQAILAEMIPDMENEIELDLSFYAELN